MSKWYESIDLRKTIRLVTEYIAYASLVVIVLDRIISAFFGASFLKYFLGDRQTENDYRITIIYLLIVIVSVNLMIAIKSLSKKFDGINKNYQGVIEILKPHTPIDYEELFRNKKNVKLLTLSGSITGDLSNNEITEILKDSKRKSNITILIANPFCQSIINRYQYDEPTSHVAGIEGIKRRLKYLFEIWDTIPKSRKKYLTIKVFNNYPTISIIQGDRDFYSSVYGYKLRGNDCPTIHSEKGKGYGLFLEKHFNKVEQNSMSIEKWHEKFKDHLDE